MQNERDPPIVELPYDLEFILQSSSTSKCGKLRYSIHSRQNCQCCATGSDALYKQKKRGSKCAKVGRLYDSFICDP
jgi:hypothetical protein